MLSGAALVAAAAGCATLPSDPAPDRPQVDPGRLAGLWYVVAASPGFAGHDEVGATVEFRLRDDGRIDEIRKAHRHAFDRPTVLATRSLGSIDPERHAHWQSGTLWPFTQEQRVVYLEPDYRHAVIADGSGEELEVLAREPELPGWVYAGLLARLVERGYTVASLRWVPQRPEDIGTRR